MKRILASILVFILLFGVSMSVGAKEERRLKLATTTSTQATGLLDVIIPPFEKAHGVSVSVIAVGTGAALKLGQNGDADVMIVHAKEAEIPFINAGYGIDRVEFMYNEFVIVGPENDPAGIRGMKEGHAAFARISASGSAFISRGDDSGTHKKELALWAAAGIKPAGAWYIEIGQGMAECLLMAQEKQAYTLTDSGTFYAYRSKLHLQALVQGDENLRNVYSIIATNPARIPKINYADAKALIHWITSPECQRLIGSYAKDGHVLFHPMLSK